jgi:hypothetical protein
MLGMESLETRRLKLDMQTAYKILFGIVDRDYSTMFSLNAAQRTRGQNYKLYAQRRRLQSQKHFFSNRIVNSWNNIPAQPEHFKSYDTFHSFLKADLTKWHRPD